MVVTQKRCLGGGGKCFVLLNRGIVKWHYGCDTFDTPCRIDSRIYSDSPVIAPPRSPIYILLKINGRNPSSKKMVLGICLFYLSVGGVKTEICFLSYVLSLLRRVGVRFTGFRDQFHLFLRRILSNVSSKKKFFLKIYRFLLSFSGVLFLCKKWKWAERSTHLRPNPGTQPAPVFFSVRVIHLTRFTNAG